MENNHTKDLKIQSNAKPSANHTVQSTTEIHANIEHAETVITPTPGSNSPTTPKTPIPNAADASPKPGVRSQSQNPSSSPRKKKGNRSKSKGRKKSHKSGRRTGSRRGRDGQPLSLGGGNRRMSRPHHATVKSLASINQPAIVNQLSKLSQDLKFRRELKKALTELKQKEEDYRYAVEIGESLTKENEYLKRQLDDVETALSSQENDNNLLKKKLETLSMTYRSDLYKYHQDLQAHQHLVAELKREVTDRETELSQQQIKTQHKYRYGGPGAATMDDLVVQRLTQEDLINLTAADLTTKLEKQLYLEVQREMDIQKEHEKQVETLLRRLDSMQNLQHEYDTMRKDKKELESIVSEQQHQHLQMQKSIEAEAIYLATQKANLEEENETLLNMLDQRDYEVQILNQQLQLQLQQHHAAASAETGGRFSDAASVGSNLYNIQYQYDQDAPFDVASVTSLEYFHPYGQQAMSNGQEQDGDSKDEGPGANEYDDNEADEDGVVDEIADLMDNMSTFDDLEDENTMRSHISSGPNSMVAPMAAPVPVMPPSQRRAERERKRKEQKKETKEVAFDKIKEYLHLTASAVKIKYPTVRGVASADLIKRVKELPFYKYHDQMVKIMENEIKRKRDEQRQKREKEKADKDSLNKPTMEKRNSFMGIFGWLGAKPTPKEEKEKAEREKAEKARSKAAKASIDEVESSDHEMADYKSEGMPGGNGHDHDTATNGRRKTTRSRSRPRKRKRSRSRNRKRSANQDDADGSTSTGGTSGRGATTTPKARKNVDTNREIYMPFH